MHKNIRHRLVAWILTTLLMPGLALAAAADDTDAEGSWSVSPWSFSLDGTFGGYSSAAGIDYGLIPYVSYHLSDRVRLDAAVGFAWNDEGLSYASVDPGARYYLYRSPNRRLAVNSGGMLSFEIYEREPQVPEARILESGSARAASSSIVTAPAEDRLFRLRLVPVEVEVWIGERQGWSLGLDWQSSVTDDLSLDGDGLGIVAGYRLRF